MRGKFREMLSETYKFICPQGGQTKWQNKRSNNNCNWFQ